MPRNRSFALLRLFSPLHSGRAWLLMAGMLISGSVCAAPEPKVSVEFSVTNGNQLLVAREQNHPIVAVEFYNGSP